MADSRDEDKWLCPFRVKVPGQGNYWLFDLPGNWSRIVEDYTETLTKSCDSVLANSDSILRIVKRTVSVIQTCSKTDAIRLGSQCNRLTKHVEATSIYLCNFKSIAMPIAKKLQCAMKCLYNYRPPRDTEAKQMLNAIADSTKIVLQATEKQLSLLTKLSCVTRDAITGFLEEEKVTVTVTLATSSSSTLTNFLNGAVTEPNDTETLAMFNEVVQKLYFFWDKLIERLTIVSTMTNEIKENTPQTDSEGFDEFKVKVIKTSSNWLALRKFCSKYIDHMSPPSFREDAEDTVPTCFDDLDISTHFSNIEVLLLADSNHDLKLEERIQVFSSWVQPKLHTTVYRCSELAKEATELVSCFDSGNASKKLVEIEQQSQHVAIMTTIYLKRLRNIESYAECQQDNMMEKKHKLEKEMNEKQKQLEKKENELSKAKQQLSDHEAKKKNAEKKKKDAEKKRKDYAASLRKLNERSLRCLCTRVLLRSLQEQAKDEEEKTHSNEVCCERLRGVIKNLESQRQRLKKEIPRLSQKIQKLKTEYDYSVERLQEMKVAIADLKKSIYSWSDFLANVEHGEKRANFMDRLLQKANKQKNAKKSIQ